MPDGSRILPVLAAAAVLIGVTVAARSVREMQQTRRHITDKVNRLSALEALRGGEPASPEALRTLEALPDQEPEDLESLCASLLEGIAYEYEPTGITSVGSAWLSRRVRIRIDRMPAEKLGPFLTRIESGRPPWRLRDASIEAVMPPGTVRVQLDVEALHKEEI